MKNKKIKILFLYTELAQYFLSCVNHLTNEHKNIEVHIIRWKINSEAPFNLKTGKNIFLHKRENFDEKKMLAFSKNLGISILICSGWIDKTYLKIAKYFFKKIPTVLMFDNKWKGNLKQYLASFLSRFFLLKRFSNVWVVGESQKIYAKKLGFSDENIGIGFYSADVDFFYKMFKKNELSKKKKFPKRFIFVGRYIENKGIFDLWKAFIELQKEYPNDWELWCLGEGEFFDKKIENEKIKHFGFVQKKDIHKFIEKTGVFILPSHFEPWGVVVHEFVSAGFPLLCSEEVGASSCFLENKKNGFYFPAKNINEMKKSMKKIINLSEKEIFKMSEKSVFLSKKINHKKWSNQLLKFLKISIH